jgi:hypothetical protein
MKNPKILNIQSKVLNINNLLKKVNKIEVLDQNGRTYNWKLPNKINVNLQDNCKTLKVFISFQY